jgi:2-polyprenyl-3-methyl-5-hydroxy-6-metoxy-1,4-benzoquinol methylase
MAAQPKGVRHRSYGEGGALTVVDRAGVWLSGRQIRIAVPDFRGKRVGDFGCGYEASFARSILEDALSVVLVDVSLNPDLGTRAKVTAVEGILPDALSGLEDASLDVVTCNSVLEHLWNPQETLDAFFRLTAPGGVCLINVPSWRGKRWLELAAFRLNLSPPDEMDDHKMYYDPQQLWPMLVLAGFKPRNIRVFRHKFGLNTFAICRKP